nr:hypothetical protein Iba_scaffold16584CG0030 [Ipomoea batatas]
MVFRREAVIHKGYNGGDGGDEMATQIVIRFQIWTERGEFAAMDVHNQGQRLLLLVFVNVSLSQYASQMAHVSSATQAGLPVEVFLPILKPGTTVKATWGSVSGLPSDNKNASSFTVSMKISENRVFLLTWKIDASSGSKEKARQCRSQMRFAISENAVKKAVSGGYLPDFTMALWSRTLPPVELISQQHLNPTLQIPSPRKAPE